MDKTVYIYIVTYAYAPIPYYSNYYICATLEIAERVKESMKSTAPYPELLEVNIEPHILVQEANDITYDFSSLHVPYETEELIKRMEAEE